MMLLGGELVVDGCFVDGESLGVNSCELICDSDYFIVQCWLIVVNFMLKWWFIVENGGFIVSLLCLVDVDIGCLSHAHLGIAHLKQHHWNRHGRIKH